ncbi:MAG: apolipoprotein N-acyltransferase [Xanthobacteraceae bacterium]
MTLNGLHNSIVLAWGWRRGLIAFVAGALSALAMAPFNFWPILFLTFPTLVWLIDGAGVGRWGGVGVAAATGWCFGFGYFVAGLYWIGYAFLVDAPTFGWLLPFAVIGLPALLAVYTAIGVALARVLWTRGRLRILALGVTLTATEWLRGHALTGFPWNSFGYALAAPLPLAQGASLIGLWGLTFIAIVVFASPATLADDRAENPRPWLPLVLGVAVLVGLGGWGSLRLLRLPTQLVDKVHLRIMQPNLQQDVKFTQLLPPNAVLITGAVRVAEPINPSAPAVYNSIYAIDHSGSIVALYDKVHLVPFGEYLPFEKILARLGFQELTKQRGGFLAGDRRRLIAIPGAPVALPLICYEIIFPDDVVPRGQRPGWIVNVTNDGWFGISTGPYQHLQQARIRAIEEGLPVVRAANTGISAVVDPLGRIVNSLPLGREGVIDSPLPRSVRAPLYARVGDAPAIVMVAIALFLVVRQRFQSGIAE